MPRATEPRRQSPWHPFLKLLPSALLLPLAGCTYYLDNFIYELLTLLRSIAVQGLALVLFR